MEPVDASPAPVSAVMEKLFGTPIEKKEEKTKN